jgi:hypothetical protein
LILSETAALNEKIDNLEKELQKANKVHFVLIYIVILIEDG